MKEYVLSESELGELSGLQTGATASFALGTLLIGFWFTISQAIDFADKVPPLIVTKWHVYGTVAFWTALIAFGVGAFFRIRGHTRLGKIKSETTHSA